MKPYALVLLGLAAIEFSIKEGFIERRVRTGPRMSAKTHIIRGQDAVVLGVLGVVGGAAAVAGGIQWIRRDQQSPTSRDFDI